MLETARREELIDSNPAGGVERPKVERKRWRILEHAEVQRVAQAFTDERGGCAVAEALAEALVGTTGRGYC